MMWLDRWLDRLRPGHDHDEALDEGTRAAIERSEEIHRKVRRQEPEVQHHRAFVHRTLRENELAPKIRRAVRESY